MSDTYFYMLIWLTVSLSHIATAVGLFSVVLYFNPIKAWPVLFSTIWKNFRAGWVDQQAGASDQLKAFGLACWQTFVYLGLPALLPVLYLIHGCFGLWTVWLAFQNIQAGQNPFYQSIGEVAYLRTITGSSFILLVAVLVDVAAILLHTLQPAQRQTMLQAYVTMMRLDTAFKKLEKVLEKPKPNVST